MLEDKAITYSFPVPIQDVDGATLIARDKAITFMRWIRKALEDKTFIITGYIS